MILGLYFSAKLARALPGGGALVALYLVLVLWVWVAKPVGNFMLLWDRFARYALRPREKLEAVLVGGGVLLGIALLVAGAFWLGTPVFIAGCCLTASAFPLSLTLTNGSSAGRWIFGSIGFGALALAPLLALDAALDLLPASVGTGLFTGIIVAALLTTWFGNLPFLRKPLA